jgi:molybdopterin converting factor small subunit
MLVRYFAGARAAAGVDEQTVDLAAGETVADLVARLGEQHGADLPRVLSLCSFLVDGTVVRDLSTPLDGHRGVDVLPPFAGG